MKNKILRQRRKGRKKFTIKPEASENSSLIQQFVKKELQEANEESFPSDEEIPLSGPEYVRARQKAEDEAIIDELIANIPRNQGYYLVIYKELSPNQFELKERIDHFHHWADMEWEIADFVRKRTQKHPQKWGSGRYRIIIKREKGLRGERYDPIDFIIDAGEPEYTPATAQPDVIASAEAQLSAIDKLLGSIRNIVPQPANPGDLQNHLAQAFTSGMNMKIGETNQGQQTMIAMVTMMMGMMKEFVLAMRPPQDVTPREDPSQSLARTIGMLKDLKLLPESHPPNQPTFKDFLNDLKGLGLEPFKSQNPMEQVQQVKAIASLLGEFMHAGTQERPSLAEKIVDTLIPNIPSILNNIKGLSDNYVKIQTQKLETAPPSAPPAPIQIPKTAPPHDEQFSMVGIEGGKKAPSPSPEQKVEDPMNQYFQMLEQAIRTQNVNFFPQLAGILQLIPGGQELIINIIEERVNPENLVTLVQHWGGPKFLAGDLQIPLKAFAEKFIAWLKVETQRQAQALQQAQQNGTGQRTTSPPCVVAVCQKCGSEYEYEHINDFETSNKVCNAQLSAIERCDGMLEIITSVAQ